MISSLVLGASPMSYPSDLSWSRTALMESKTSRYAAVPTLPLSGGKLKMVIAIFLSFFSFFFNADHFMARSAKRLTRSANGTDRPVAPSRPAKMIGSMAPSISGSETCNATWMGWRPNSDDCHSSNDWKTRGTAHKYGTFKSLRTLAAFLWSCDAGPPIKAKPVRLTTVSTMGFPFES